MKKLFILFAVLIFALPVMAQNRGGELESVVGKNVTVGKQWAVFIAIDKYRDNGWTNLNHPVKDAREIQQILREHYIIDNWRELFDDKASAEGIRALFRNLRQEVGKDDSVFVFHAGHGFKDDDTDKGAWIPADASSNRDRKGGWIGHDEIRAYLDLLPAKHVFLISDSCYSGDLLANPRAGAFPRFDNDYYRKAYSLVSRQVMTSGASETVPDASDFARRLKNTLTRAEGACVDPVKLFEQVREASGTTPRLGAMPSSLHHKDGSFLFFKKQTTAVNVPQQPESPPGRQTSAVVGSITITSEIAGEILIDGTATGTRIKAEGNVTINGVSTGMTEVAVKEGDGTIIKALHNVMVRQGQTVSATIQRPLPTPTPSSTPPTPVVTQPDKNVVREGTASMASEEELPGWVISTDAYPRNTIIDITNLETGKITRVIVASSLDSPGLLAKVSREAGEAIGMRSGALTRIRIQRSEL